MSRIPPMTSSLSKGRGAVYRRVSGAHDERTASLDVQLRATATKLRAAGYEVDEEVDVFTDHHSGADLEERPGLQAMRRAISEGRYAAVGFYAVDRLTREMGHSAVIFSHFCDNDVTPFSATENIDATPEGQLFVIIRSYFAQIERAKIKDRTESGRADIIGKGQLLHGGFAKFGYRYSESEKRAKDRGRRVRVIDEEAAETVRLVFRLASERGMSASGIAKYLNTLGVETQHGYRARKGIIRFKKGPRNRTPKWTACSVLLILKDATYTGASFINRNKVVGKCKTGAFKMGPVPREEWLTLPDDITPPLVDPEVFAAIQEGIGDKTRRTERTRNGRRPYLLRGMCWCASCGRKMYCDVESTAQHPVYRCRRIRYDREPSFLERECKGMRMKASFIEARAWEALVGLLVEPGRLDAAIATMADTGDEERLRRDVDAGVEAMRQAEGDHEMLYGEWLAAKRQKHDRLAERLRADYLRQEEIIEAYRKTVAEYKVKLQARTSPERIASNFRTRFERIAAGIREGDLTWQEKRDALEAAGCRVEGNGYEADIYFEVFERPEGECGIPTTSTVRFEENTSYLRVAVTR